ncbi:MAG: hypothetical protein WC477_07225 [Patescibacteria group bacterium]
MSLDVFIGLLFQLAAVMLVLLKTRERWLSYVGALFVLVSFLYYGAWEVVQIIFPGRNFYRTLVVQEDIDIWMIIVGIGMILFAGVYCLSLRRIKKPLYDPEQLAQWAKNHLPDWRLVLLLAVPGFWINISGQDFGYWVNNLSTYMTGFALITASTALILHNGPQFVLPVLLGQSLCFALVGARSAVVLNALILLSIFIRLGVPLRWRHMFVLGIVGIVLMVLISAARAVGGRFTQREEFAGAATRVQWLMDGLTGLIDPAIMQNAVADDFIYRFDGNAFNAMVSRKLDAGWPPAGFQSFWNNFALMVPSFINPQKLDNSPINLFEKDYTVAYYGLPEGIDYLVGTPGIIYSYHGVWGLWCIMTFIGWLYAQIDGWLARSRSTWAFCMGIGFVSTSLVMELAVLGYFSTFRSLIVFYIFVQVIIWVQRLFHQEARPVQQVLGAGRNGLR